MKRWQEAARDSALVLTAAGIIAAGASGELRDHVGPTLFSPGPVYTMPTINATIGSSSMFASNLRYQIPRAR